MEKPTIFFSHSSKDKELILPIKNKIEDITSNVIDIFMSSDGQSIPFGQNWVHKIEEGLNKTQIMFVFITNNSIESSWIYFEAGFAYSKHIEVIPIGLGVDICQLKPPLNLLQGFNIESSESLNNFISIINKKFNLQFKENFENCDFNLIISKMQEYKPILSIYSIFSYAEFILYSQIQKKDKIIRHNINQYYSDIKLYLDEQKISFSCSELNYPYNGKVKTILVRGIKIELYGTEREPERNRANYEHYLKISISTIKFASSFELLKNLLAFLNIDLEKMYLHFYFHNQYDCLKQSINISSILSDNMHDYNCLKDNINMYKYKNNLVFGLIDVNKHKINSSNLYVLAISFDIKTIQVSDFLNLILSLTDCGVISKKS